MINAKFAICNEVFDFKQKLHFITEELPRFPLPPSQYEHKDSSSDKYDGCWFAFGYQEEKVIISHPSRFPLPPSQYEHKDSSSDKYDGCWFAFGYQEEKVIISHPLFWKNFEALKSLRTL